VARALDETDRKIVAFLQENPDAVQRDIAGHIGLTQPAISARLRRLRREGLLRVLVGLDPQKAGLLMAKIDVRTTDPQGLMDTFRNCPLLVNAFLALGGTDVSLLMIGESVENLESIVDVHIRPMSGVQSVDLQVVTRVANPLILPKAMAATKCDRTRCGFRCPSCRYYLENFCTGCPATIFYKGTFWR
jgi:DNA-binding Lrp family transcriptional regulator